MNVKGTMIASTTPKDGITFSSTLKQSKSISENNYLEGAIGAGFTVASIDYDLFSDADFIFWPMYAFAKCMRVSYKYSSNTIYAVFCPADSTNLGIAREFDRADLDEE